MEKMQRTHSGVFLNTSILKYNFHKIKTMTREHIKCSNVKILI